MYIMPLTFFPFFFFQMIWLWKRKRKPVRQPQPNQEISLINKEKFIGWRELQTRKYSDPITSQTIKQNKWTMWAHCNGELCSIYICRNNTMPLYIRNPIFHLESNSWMISFPPTPDLTRRRVTFAENSVPHVYNPFQFLFSPLFNLFI